jgi:hypothetical protein
MSTPIVTVLSYPVDANQLYKDFTSAASNKGWEFAEGRVSEKPSGPTYETQLTKDSVSANVAIYTMQGAGILQLIIFPEKYPEAKGPGFGPAQSPAGIVTTGPIVEVPESRGSWGWKDSGFCLMQQWSTAEWGRSGGFYGSVSSSESNVDVYLLKAPADPLEVTNAEAFDYSSGTVLAYEGDTMFFRSESGFYGAADTPGFRSVRIRGYSKDERQREGEAGARKVFPPGGYGPI